MANHEYVSPYSIIDDRLRSSVMAAQGNRSIHEVHQRGFRPGKGHSSASFEPEFNDESFSSALDTITLVIECMCFEGAEGWEEKQRLVPARPRGRGPHPPQVILRDDRAVCGFSFSMMWSELRTWRVQLRDVHHRREAFDFFRLYCD